MTPPPIDSPPRSPGEADSAGPAPGSSRSVEDGPVLRDHVYDGIEEFDQKLPNWWLWSWYIFIIMFVIWWIADRQFDMFSTNAEVVDAEMKVVKEKKAADLALLMESLDDESFWAKSKDPAMKEAGRVVYEKNCTSCHGAELDAMLGEVKLPGVPLNDAEWKYGSKPMEIFNLITKGSPDIKSGMVSWEPVIGGEKVAEVVAYILSHHEQPAGDTPPPTPGPVTPPANK